MRNILLILFLFCTAQALVAQCSVGFGTQQDPSTPTTVWFAPYATDSSLFSTYTLTWDFGDGSTVISNAPMHQYNAMGSFVVCVTATFSSGCTVTACNTLNIGGGTSSVCNAAFEYAISASSSNEIVFSDISTATNTIYSYVWDFGDSTTATIQNPTHSYATNGNYTVCLSIYSGIPGTTSFCTDQQCQNIYIGTTPSDSLFIGGMVVPSDVNCICPMLEPMTIYFIQYNADPGTLTAVDSVVLNGTEQSFSAVLPVGEYLIKAALHPSSPQYFNYLPSYYEGATHWSNAAPLSNATAINILYMQAGAYPGGTGFIGGNISDGAGKTDAVLSHISVLLLDENGTAIAQTYSNNEGNYSFAQLAFGSYQILVDIPGLTATPQNVVLSPDSPSASNLNFEALPTQVDVATAISELLIEPFNIAINPGIVTGSGEIQLYCPVAYSSLHIVIYNDAGAPVWSHTGNFAQGTSTFSFNANRWASGYYNAFVFGNSTVLDWHRFLKL
jgi:PKD repeat protein